MLDRICDEIARSEHPKCLKSGDILSFSPPKRVVVVVVFENSTVEREKQTNKRQTASQLAPPPPPPRRRVCVPRSPKPRRRGADEPVRRSGRLDGRPPLRYSEEPLGAMPKEVRKLKSGSGSRSTRERGEWGLQRDGFRGGGVGGKEREREREKRESKKKRERERPVFTRKKKKTRNEKKQKKPPLKKKTVTSADEVYSQAHVDSLGTHHTPWELFVDGYDHASGQRLYDSVRGVTCHQCRQKTLGTHSQCDRCGRLSGIFCGDCLFMRYGENVAEANAAREAARARREERRRRSGRSGVAAAGAAAAAAAGAAEGEDDQEEEEEDLDHGWVCPPCRGLCNCSFHRARRGWAPTGSLYRYALAEGYASVAHFLVLTNLSEGVVVPPGLRQARREDSGAADANAANAAAAAARANARRPVSAAVAAAAAVGVVPDPPVTTTVARGGKPRSSKQQEQANKRRSPAQAPRSPPPLPSAKRARKGAKAAARQEGRPQQLQLQQLTSPTLEPAPVVVASVAAAAESSRSSLLPNGKRRTGSFMCQLRLNPEALKKRRGGGGAAAAAKKKAKNKSGGKASSSASKKKKKPAAATRKKKAAVVVSVSPREPRVPRRSARGGAEVAAAC